MSGVRSSERDRWFEDAMAAGGLPQRGSPAWLLSLILHATIFLAIGLFGGGGAAPAGGELERSVGIALVQRSADRVRYLAEPDAAAGGASPSGGGESEPGGAAPTSPFPQLDKLPVGLAASLPSRADAVKVAVGGGPSLPGADSLSQGHTATRGGVPGGGASTQVFGVKGTGSRFVYVFDRSASMEGYGGRPIRAAKRELLSSLQDLSSVHQFLIIFYNEQPTVFNPDYPLPPKLCFATEANKRAAEEFVSRIEPAGGTRHDDALRLALNVQPDVIFLLTDADDPRLSSSDLASILRRNRGGAKINTIEFGSRATPEPDNFMMRLARQNDGQHVYVQLSHLK